MSNTKLVIKSVDMLSWTYIIMSSLTIGTKIVVGFVCYQTTFADVAHTFLTKVDMGVLVQNC